MATRADFSLSSDVFDDVLKSLPGGVFIVEADTGKRILYASQQVADLFECDSVEDFMRLVGSSFHGMVHPDDYESVIEQMRVQERSGSKQFDHINYRILTKSGRVRHIEDFGKKTTLQDGREVYYVFIVDEEMKNLTSDIDQLTGLCGKNLFAQSAADKLKKLSRDPSRPPMVFLYFNIIKFKMFNVKYGKKSGDVILQRAAELLLRTFPDDLAGRLGDDHFVLLAREQDIQARVAELYRRLRALEFEVKLDGKVGVYRVTDYNIKPELACDLARLASDSIKTEPGKYLEYYTEEIGRKIDIQYYVINHIDEAVEKKYIKVYYQPVVRSISGNLCGMEALARWIDPEVGFLSPGDFIPALEDSHLIHKLDTYMIREICRNYRRCIDNNIPVVPVSLNLSRLDFILTDIGREIDACVEEFQVPRDMLNIEITESMFVEDAVRIGQEIDRFHGAGFQVWMDDFGSGYSSLNILKDYQFDELKIDMAFLSSFSEKSRSILQATVRMSKDIDIQTLAEGVETPEQVAFLRNIGCEKLQGYFFGKPALYDDSLQHCIDQGMQVETRAQAAYYDKTGKINFMTDKPLAIFEDDGTRFHFLFANEAYLESLRSNGTPSLEKAEENINHAGSPMQRMFRTFADSIIASGKREEMTYPSGDQYMQLTARTIARCNGSYMHVCSLSNITRNVDRESQETHDSLMRNILYLYDLIALADYRTDTMEFFDAMQGETRIRKNRLVEGIEQATGDYRMTMVYPDDRERFAVFADKNTLPGRLNESRAGYVSDYFRIREAEGNYGWYACTMMAVPKTDGNVCLVLTRKAAMDDPVVKEKLLENLETTTNVSRTVRQMAGDFTEQDIWKTLRDYSRVKYFWKDMNRRFVGVSQSFLEYYDLKSEEELIGRTDEQMRWHVADGPYKSDEESVLNEGAHTMDVPGKCIIRGVVHNIVASKMPIYKDGKIVGLFGYFIDAERADARKNRIGHITTVDLVTGLSNVRGVIENFVNYAAEYESHGKDFAAMNFTVEGFDHFQNVYGEAAGNEFLKKIAQIILDNFSTHACVGRLMGARFIVLYKCPDQLTLRAAIDRIKNEIRQLSMVAGYPCTCFPAVALTYAAAEDNYEGMLLSLLKPII